MFCGSEKVGKIQRFTGELSHEEQKMVSTVGQKIGRTDENVAHTRNARVNRVKLCKQTMRKLRATKNMFKVERCGSSLLTSNRKLNLEQNC